VQAESQALLFEAASFLFESGRAKAFWAALEANAHLRPLVRRVALAPFEAESVDLVNHLHLLPALKAIRVLRWPLLYTQSSAGEVAVVKRSRLETLHIRSAERYRPPLAPIDSYFRIGRLRELFWLGIVPKNLGLIHRIGAGHLRSLALDKFAVGDWDKSDLLAILTRFPGLTSLAVTPHQPDSLPPINPLAGLPNLRSLVWFNDDLRPLLAGPHEALEVLFVGTADAGANPFGDEDSESDALFDGESDPNGDEEAGSAAPTESEGEGEHDSATATPTAPALANPVAASDDGLDGPMSSAAHDEAAGETALDGFQAEQLDFEDNVYGPALLPHVGQPGWPEAHGLRVFVTRLCSQAEPCRLFPSLRTVGLFGERVGNPLSFETAQTRGVRGLREMARALRAEGLEVVDAGGRRWQDAWT